MLRLKLKRFMRQHGVSEIALTNAIADVFLDRGDSVSERYLRYIVQNTEPLTRDNPQKIPTLIVLGLIIKGLREITGEKVDIMDVLEYQTETPEIETKQLETVLEDDKEPEKIKEFAESFELVLIPADPETEKLLDEVSELTVQMLKERGYLELSQDAAEFNEGYRDADTQSSQKKKKQFEILPIILIGLLMIATSYIAFDYFVLKPRLIAGASRLYSFSNRVRPTSDLPVPTLIGPEGEIEDLAPTLRISSVPKALGYEFYIEDIVSNDGFYSGSITSTSFLIPENALCPNSTYTWRARALGHDGWTSFSSPLEFTVSSTAIAPTQHRLLRLATIKHKPEVPEIVAPIGTVNTTTPTLEVKEDPDVYGYGFYIRDLQSDGLVYDNNFVNGNVAPIPEGVLEDGGLYQWNVRSRNCHYWSDFSPAQVFTVNVK